MKLIKSLNNLLSEQVIQKTEETTFNVPTTAYPNGIYSIEKVPEAIQSVNNILKQIVNFAKKFKSSEFEIKIEAGESAVTNVNREVSPPAQLKPGVLAKLRAQSLHDYILSELKKLVSSGDLVSLPKITILPTNVENGTQKYTYTKGKDDPKDGKYEEDKYIKITIPSKGVTETCLANAKIIFEYKHTKEATSCSGNHKCNRASFNVMLGKYNLGLISLNNEDCKGGSDCDRKSVITISPEMAKAIAEDENIQRAGKVLLGLVCTVKPVDGNYCHASAPTISVETVNGVILKPFCVDYKLPYIENNVRYSTKKETYIATLTPCLDRIIEFYDSQNQPNFSAYK